MANKNFKNQMKAKFETFMKSSSDLYLDLHYEVDEVSDEMKELLHYNEEDYEHLTEKYNEHGFNFRIIRNGEVYELLWDKGLNDFYVCEDCLTMIKSDLKEDLYYDACVNEVYYL